MRISDWGSDVCSSDLRYIKGRRPFLGGPGQSWLADAALGRSHQPGINVDDPIQKQNNFHLYPGIDVFRRVDPIYEFPDAEIKDARLTATHEIGRASCRERVGQYV